MNNFSYAIGGLKQKYVNSFNITKLFLEIFFIKSRKMNVNDLCMSSLALCALATRVKIISHWQVLCHDLILIFPRLSLPQSLTRLKLLNRIAIILIKILNIFHPLKLLYLCKLTRESLKCLIINNGLV